MKGAVRIAAGGLVAVLLAGACFLGREGAPPEDRAASGRVTPSSITPSSITPSSITPSSITPSSITPPSVTPTPPEGCAIGYWELRNLADSWLRVWRRWVRSARDRPPDEIERLSRRAGGKMAVLTVAVRAIGADEPLRVARDLLLRATVRAQRAMRDLGSGRLDTAAADAEEARQLWIAADEALESNPC